MEPFDFEQYVGRLLEQQGYKVKITGKPGDLGVDIVAQKGSLQCAVQVKLQVKPVSRRAISDVVAGKHHYGCNAAMVVTNNIFAKQAVDLARSTRCILIERTILARWITSCQRKICPFCQKQNWQQAQFCGYCGKSLLLNQPKQSAK
jgi:restriction system protein